MIQTLNIDSPWSAIDCAVQAELLAAASPPPRQEGGFLLSLSILLALSFALNSFTGSALGHYIWFTQIRPKKRNSGQL